MLELPPEAWTFGILSMAFVIFMIAMGIKVATKYFEMKDKVFLFAGWSFIGLGIPWTGVTINFLLLLFYGLILYIEWFLMFTIVHIPFSHMIFALFMVRLYDISPKSKKIIAGIYIALWAVFEVLFVWLVLTNVEAVGSYINPFQVDFAPFAEIMLITSMILVLGGYLLLGIHYMRADIKKIKIQGRLIFFSSFLFAIASAFEVLFPIPLLIILARVLVMLFAVIFYVGFIMPKWAEKIFVKE